MRALLPLSAVAILAAAGTYDAFDKPLTNDQKIEHALDRLTFGPRPGDIDAVRRMGLDKWIVQQLHPELLPQIEVAAPPQPTDLKSARPRDVIQPLWSAKIERAAKSERQLEEILVDFWFNHFNVFFDKGADRLFVAAYERDAIRPNVLGRFRDLLAATAEHPAMLFYLDNWQSVAPNAPVNRLAKAKGKQARGLNENYARELMELHTLGVDGGYTQQDVIEVARAFTGWTIDQPRQGGGFAYNDRIHDKGEKTVLGVKIPAGGGRGDGERVLDILARHPNTARHISAKLAQRFVADDPPPALVTRMSETFRKTDGDIRAVLRTMIDSREFFSQGAYKAKVKTPLELAVSAVRFTGAEVRNGAPLAQRIATIGQPLYRKQEPTGYAMTAEEWVNSAALVERMNFATALANNKVPGTLVGPGPTALSTLDTGSPDALARHLGSPEFQRR